jgi:hypothetical protein
MGCNGAVGQKQFYPQLQRHLTSGQMLRVSVRHKARGIWPETKVFEDALSDVDFLKFLFFCVASFHFGHGFRKQLYVNGQLEAVTDSGD